MTAFVDLVAAFLVLIGAGFGGIAALGVYRLPDFYTRMHAASKAGTLGSGLMLIAIALSAGDVGVATRAIAGIVFFLLTAPVAAHLLARAAYFTGVRPWDGTHIDDIAGKYRDRMAHLDSAPGARSKD